MSAEDGRLKRLEESLRLCQLELAQVRAEQEPIIEDHKDALDRLKHQRRELRVLSKAINDHLMALPSGSGFWRRVRRFILRARRSHSEEWRAVRMLQASDLFSGPWYLRTYPEVIATGLPPALHYLRHGATQGLDPGPNFSTRGYFDGHPDVAASGTNPLIHHLRSQRQAVRATEQK